MDQTILIVEPDDDLLSLLTAHFSKAAEFKFETAKTGAGALLAILKYHPQLILMEMQLPDKPGIEVFRELKSYPRMAHIPVIFLASGTQVFLRNQMLLEGIYDFIQKPLDVAEVTLRIQNSLKRFNRDGLLHPQTDLPTGNWLTSLLEAAKEKQLQYTFTLKLDQFDTFKDAYGFMDANEVIKYLGTIIRDVVNEFGNPEDMVGHRHDAEFVIATTSKRGDDITKALNARLSEQLPQFYNFVDRERGYIEMKNSTGDVAKISLMSLTIDKQSLL